MTDMKKQEWANPPTLKDLQQDLELARSPHNAQKAKVGEWLENLHIKSEENKKEAGRSSIQPKTIRRNNEWRYTSFSEPFLNTPDIFNVDPITAEDVHAAKMNQLVLNNQLNTKIDKVSFIDRYVRKCVDEGTVILRTGWSFASETRVVVYPEFELRPVENARQMQELARASQMDPTSLPEELIEALLEGSKTGQPMYPHKTGEVEQEETVVTMNQPTLQVCDSIFTGTCQLYRYSHNLP